MRTLLVFSILLMELVIGRRAYAIESSVENQIMGFVFPNVANRQNVYGDVNEAMSLAQKILKPDVSTEDAFYEVVSLNSMLRRKTNAHHDLPPNWPARQTTLAKAILIRMLAHSSFSDELYSYLSNDLKRREKSRLVDTLSSQLVEPWTGLDADENLNPLDRLLIARSDSKEVVERLGALNKAIAKKNRALTSGQRLRTSAFVAGKVVFFAAAVSLATLVLTNVEAEALGGPGLPNELILPLGLGTFVALTGSAALYFWVKSVASSMGLLLEVDYRPRPPMEQLPCPGRMTELSSVVGTYLKFAK